ncbi:hypothetical protein CASFOL_011318 [Castilleja foliolosa]|uniref:F-box associated beta-propeller type 3 domain-containing protein n=1 Tax=Castilleja foliolosa TaxID=1961234 RepID=A0ABD3DV67_9LAMI
MPEFSILGSSNGLLCLVNSLFPDSLCLYNPFRRGHIEIPKNSVFKDKSVVYGFGFNPITNDYKVIMIADHKVTYSRKTGFSSYYNRPVSDVQIYSVNSNVWLNRGIMPYCLEKWSKRGVLVSGRLHWVSRCMKLNGDYQRTIVSYNLVDDAFDVILCPTPDTLRRWTPSYLSSLDGCLSVVVHIHNRGDAFHVWILREYGVCESWVKAYTVGTYNLVPRVPGIIKSLLCVLRSGELLLEYWGSGNSLVVYDPMKFTFKSLNECLRIPEAFDDALFHVGGLTAAAAFR